MNRYGWNVEVLPFQDHTPFGVKDFANIVATLQIGRNFRNSQVDPSLITNLKNRIVFACHYDSKLFNNFDFVGATDSAVPCAMLIDLAKFLSENFDRNTFNGLFRHLQFLFFDGEEAFVEWSRQDSTYGSRKLANQLKQTYGSTAFDSMDLFVLLDLLGGDNSRFLNYFPQTSNVYHMLSSIGKIKVRVML